LPHLKAALEIEPYTVEWMLHGERFEVERVGRAQPRLIGWQKGGIEPKFFGHGTFELGRPTETRLPIRS